MPSCAVVTSKPLRRNSEPNIRHSSSSSSTRRMGTCGGAGVGVTDSITSSCSPSVPSVCRGPLPSASTTSGAPSGRPSGRMSYPLSSIIGGAAGFLSSSIATPVPSPSCPLISTKAQGARGSASMAASATSPRASRCFAPRSTPWVKRAWLSEGVPGFSFSAPERKVRWMCSTIRRASNPTTRPLRSGSSASTCRTRSGCSKGWKGRRSISTTPVRICETRGASSAWSPRTTTGSRESVASWARVPSSCDTSGVSRFPTASTTSTGLERSAFCARLRSGTARNPKSAREKASERARAEARSGSTARRESFVTVSSRTVPGPSTGARQVLKLGLCSESVGVPERFEQAVEPAGHHVGQEARGEESRQTVGLDVPGLLLRPEPRTVGHVAEQPGVELAGGAGLQRGPAVEHQARELVHLGLRLQLEHRQTPPERHRSCEVEEVAHPLGQPAVRVQPRSEPAGVGERARLEVGPEGGGVVEPDLQTVLGLVQPELLVGAGRAKRLRLLGVKEEVRGPRTLDVVDRLELVLDLVDDLHGGNQVG